MSVGDLIEMARNDAIVYNCLMGLLVLIWPVLYASTLLFDLVNYVFCCYIYVFLLLYMFHSRYCVSLCCSVYCLCVNVYCTAASCCQHNCS